MLIEDLLGNIFWTLVLGALCSIFVHYAWRLGFRLGFGTGFGDGRETIREKLRHIMKVEGARQKVDSEFLRRHADLFGDPNPGQSSPGPLETLPCPSQVPHGKPNVTSERSGGDYGSLRKDQFSEAGHDGGDRDEVCRLEDLERENRRLREAVTELTLEKQTLKEKISKKDETPQE